ncbi:uncharacterized protein N7498_006235 [Penicillium cinerascens]|uniref:Uncharacterized protein n=1 Tax=Penicillium cinerascens TaxID=70096 RepID=A0A9W9SX29_9EURO|nr:uncharacterized protein N7498_006235 [Penicillium cinerascens]KAJ5201572.1 hypothetical protein N7498_006235 [Penicillium cinerascens]
MADPPGRRRSSISEQIQRVFSVDRSDKVCFSDIARAHSYWFQKRRSVQSEFGLSAVLAQPKDGREKSEATISPEAPVQYGQDETRPSSFTYSQNSGLPSTATPHSTPPFRPVISVDPTSPQVASEAKKRNAEDICKSPTWDSGRRERRATKRLEAERKELGQRLLRLEEAQSKLDQGVFDRNSRRLTKKQPLDSASRSSSADREGRRSSSVFSGIFSRSRRSSRSRANSKDSESRRQSSDSPPTLPLTLPERFGAAVSRELAIKHGTNLVPSHQMERTVHALHALHSSPKSDDLRENWKMAEAWQRSNGTHDSGPPRIAAYKPGISGMGQLISENVSRKDQPQPHVHATELSADLDRETFTATLRHDRRPVGNKAISNSQGTIMTRPKMPSRDRAQSEANLHAPDAIFTRVTTARQLHDLVPPEVLQGPYKSFQSSISTPAIPKSKHHKKNRISPGLQATPKSFKSSPLSLSPFTTDDPGGTENNNISRAPEVQNRDPSIIPPPLQIQVQRQNDESRGRSRQVVSVSPTKIVQSYPKNTSRSEHQQSILGPALPSGNSGGQQKSWHPRPPSTAKDAPPTQASEEAKPRCNDGPPLPIKHAGRNSSLGNSSPKSVNPESQKEASVTTDAPANPSSEPSGQNQCNTEEVPESKPVLRCLNPPVRSRASSQSSSQASYDTADEEVLDLSKALRNHIKAKAQSETTLLTPTQEGSTSDQRLSNDMASQINTAPLAHDISLFTLRKRPKQKAKAPLPEQLIAKLFVICCHCRYWHDMPSEVYAKLACPERLPSESLLSRTFSRRNSSRRKASLRKSLLSSDPPDTRRDLTTERKSLDEDLQSSRQTQAAAGMPLTPPSCCWCGHGMSRTCCQGWTTLVQMGERHH